MRKRRFTKTHPQAILAQHDAGARVADLSREHQISAATFYKWKKGQDDDGQEEARRLAALERENATSPWDPYPTLRVRRCTLRLAWTMRSSRRRAMRC